MDALFAVSDQAIDSLTQVLFVGAECAVRQLVAQRLQHAEKMFQLLDGVGDIGFLTLVGRVEVDKRLRDLDAQRYDADCASGDRQRIHGGVPSRKRPSEMSKTTNSS